MSGSKPHRCSVTLFAKLYPAIFIPLANDARKGAATSECALNIAYDGCGIKFPSAYSASRGYRESSRSSRILSYGRGSFRLLVRRHDRTDHSTEQRWNPDWRSVVQSRFAKREKIDELSRLSHASVGSPDVDLSGMRRAVATRSLCRPGAGCGLPLRRNREFMEHPGNAKKKEERRDVGSAARREHSYPRER